VGAQDSQDIALLVGVLEELPIGIRVMRPGCQPVFSNRVFRELTGEGYRLLDRSLRPYPTEAMPVARAERERVAVEVDDVVLERADGRRVNVRALAKPLIDAGGTLTHVVLAFTDITAEVTSAAESAADRERLRTAVDHAPIILFATDRDGRVTLSEGGALPAMRLRPGEHVGRSVFELYPDNHEVHSNTRRALAGETFSTKADLGNVVLESWMAPMRDPSGRVSGMIGVATDVTERIRLEGQVAQAERLSALGRLAASVAHEINNPLAYTIEALRLGGELVAELERTAGEGAATALGRLHALIGEAAEGADRVRLTTRDLRSFSRGEVEARRPLDLDQCLAAAIKLVGKRTGTRAAIERRQGPPAVVHADENWLVQIFVNLILNAADAVPAERADQNRIRISTRLEGAAVVVEVADNGPGVPAGVREAIFEPFFTTKPVGEGTGLGLFVTRNLVTALGGSVTIGEAPEGGALFSVRLPVEGAAAPAPEPIRPPAPGKAACFSVLIIDDDPQVAELMRLSLQREYPASTVRALTSGRAAVDHLVEGARYDLVFCDLMMGELSGMRIHEELRRSAPGRERELIFMTGGVFDSVVADFLASIPNDCLDKPFDIRAEVRSRISAGLPTI
jgi:PAS domain S-box-containing protein